MTITGIFFCVIVIRLVLCQVSDTCNHEFPCKFKGGEFYTKCQCNCGEDFVRDELARQVRGTLAVDVSEIRLEWMRVKRRVYNGRLCGPTIRVKPGDKLTITLKNRLGPNREEGVHNEFRLPNTTNLHLHGLHISSQEPGDNVFIRVDPGKEFKYEYDINIAQPAGTYWYHAHYHGSTYFQVMSGMSGMLIVEDVAGMPAELAAVSCPDNCGHEIELLLQSTLQYVEHSNSPKFEKIRKENKDDESLNFPDHLAVWLRDPANSINYFTVNGKIRPNLTIDINEMKRFRIVNAGGFSSLELGITKQGSKSIATACAVREIAFDGVYLDAVRSQHKGQTYLTVGARVDWMVYCKAAGNYVLRSNPNSSNKLSIGDSRRYEGVIMNIHVTRKKQSQKGFPSSLPTRPAFIRNLRTIQIEENDRFIVELTPDFLLNRESFTNKNDPRYKMKIGTVQEWQFINTMTDASHPIHIHVNHFQIQSYNRYTGPISKTTKSGNQFVLYGRYGILCNVQHKDYRANRGDENTSFSSSDLIYLGHDNRSSLNEGILGYAKVGDWRDVLNVPPLSNITIRFLTNEYIGTVVIHCHILLHEDKGMMMVAEIVKDDIEGARINSGQNNAICPGHCFSNTSYLYPHGCNHAMKIRYLQIAHATIILLHLVFSTYSIV